MAMDASGIEKLSRAGKALYKEVRKVAQFLDRDQPLRPDIKSVAGLIQDRTMTRATLTRYLTGLLWSGLDSASEAVPEDATS